MQFYQWRGSCAVSWTVTSASLKLIHVLASPAYQEFGIWGEVLFQTLSTAPFVFTAQILFSLSTIALTSLLDFVFLYPPPGYGCLLIYAVGLISWLIFSHSPCYLLIYIPCLFPSPAPLRSQCYFIYGKESLFSTACSLCCCHDLLQYQLIIPNIATLQVLCFSILWASLVEFSSWGHLTGWSSASFLWYSLFST